MIKMKDDELKNVVGGIVVNLLMDRGPATPSADLSPATFQNVLSAFIQVDSTPGAEVNNLLGISIG